MAEKKPTTSRKRSSRTSASTGSSDDARKPAASRAAKSSTSRATKSTPSRSSAAKSGGAKTATAKSATGETVRFTKDDDLYAYREMLLVRRFEEKAGQLYGMGLIGGFCHLYIGQEAVVVGMQMALKEGDQIITGYRDHGHMIACGMEAKGVMAELTGRRSGYSKGKGGSMHMFSVEKNFYGGHGIVGAQVPLGTGLAFSNKYRENGAVSITYFGDGAANQGQVYESFNMAKLWSLPVVYVIENNKYGMGTSIERASSTTNLSHRGASFDIPGEQVDGMEVHAVRAAGARAIAHARDGKGPYILEMLTYRYRGHSMSDPAKYRTRDEVNKMRTEHDPIEHLRARLIEEHGISEDDVKKIDKEVRDIVNEAAEFAQSDPEPDPSELWTDIVR
ncbi:pyruvate dehydrogenase E1 component alpha subunit [Amorphus suaedae]